MDAASQQPPDPVVAKPAHSNTGGLLPVSTAGPRPKVLASHSQPSRHGAAGLKVVVRRLPPGLTEDEFYSSLGAEWKAGGSKADWGSYIPGKVSRDPAKHSRPARAYLHLSEEYVKALQPGEKLRPLGEKLADAQFSDARGTHNDPALLSPWPSLSEAPYGRIPSVKVRKDNRQGTIDQDQEFIDFLQELTNPVIKPTPIDALPDKEARPEEKIITPLVQYLKDKKANKNKDLPAGSKTPKQGKQEAKESKTAVSTQEKKQSAKASKVTATERKPSTAQKPEKVTKEQVKVLDKPTTTAASKSQPTAQAPASQITTSAATPAKPERKRERERGSAAAAAKILQRDLGLGGTQTGRRRREGSGTSNATPAKSTSSQAAGTASTTGQASSPATTQTSQPTATTPATVPETNETAKPANPTPTGAPSKEPSTSKQSSRSGGQSSKSAAGASSKGNTAPGKSAPSVSPTAIQAFLKHANPSQGVTEALLQSTFASFGTVTKVEIDKKKGFAYVDFGEPAGLQKAIAASPVKIAQGQVTVLERKAQAQSKKSKDPETPGAKGSGSGGTGGGSGGGGGGGGGGAKGSSQRSGRGRGRFGGKATQGDGPAQAASGDPGKVVAAAATAAPAAPVPAAEAS